MLIQNVLNILRGFDRFPLQRPTLSSYVFFLPAKDLVTNWVESQFGVGSLPWCFTLLAEFTFRIHQFIFHPRLKWILISCNTSDEIKELTKLKFAKFVQILPITNCWLWVKKENRWQIWPSLLITQPTLALNNIKARPTGLAVSAIC